MIGRALILIPILLLILVGLFFLLRPAPPTSDSDGSGADTTIAEAADEQQEVKTFDIAIQDGATMVPNEIAVVEDDRVTLRISSNTPLEFHLHGYDLATEVEPNEVAELSFDATITGRFGIENEQTQQELGVLLVQPR